MSGIRTAQEYFNSGEITQIYINGANESNKAVTNEDISKVNTIPVYCNYVNLTPMTLNSVYQKVMGWSPYYTTTNITYSNGVFTTLVDGVFEWHLERRYSNYDPSPIQPILITLDIRKNGISIYNKESNIGAATKVTEPAIIAFTSPFIFEVNANDHFEFYVKAMEDGNNPTDTRLSSMQLSANKIYNL